MTTYKYAFVILAASRRGPAVGLSSFCLTAMNLVRTYETTSATSLAPSGSAPGTAQSVTGPMPQSGLAGRFRGRRYSDHRERHGDRFGRHNLLHRSIKRRPR